MDGCVFACYLPPISFDPLLLKVVARSPLVTSLPAACGSGCSAESGDANGGERGGERGGEGGGGAAFEAARRRLLRACGELHIGGSLATNLGELRCAHHAQ